MTPGEMYWVEFPPSDSHEQAGRPPAIVIQDPKYSPQIGTVFVVPVTGQPKNLRFAGTVSIQPTDANGLLKESVILVSNSALWIEGEYYGGLESSKRKS